MLTLAWPALSLTTFRDFNRWRSAFRACAIVPQLGDVGRDSPRFVAGERLGCRSRVIKIDVSELLLGGCDKAGIPLSATLVC